jgi:hypothetical protein
MENQAHLAISSFGESPKNGRLLGEPEKQAGQAAGEPYEQ